MAGQTNSPITNTISFSVPVDDPIMDIVCSGQQGQANNYEFNTPFTILSQATGYFGGFGSGLSNPFGNRLHGLEGDGLIQFKGSFSSISFTASPFVYWGGFNVAVAVVPESETVFVPAGGLFLLSVGERFKASF